MRQVWGVMNVLRCPALDHVWENISRESAIPVLAPITHLT
jgi:hypothetical protein